MLSVTGVLTDPFGEALVNTKIRVLAEIGYGRVLENIYAEFTTDAQGGYSFPLAAGFYRVEVMVENEYRYAGKGLVNSADVGPWDLVRLLQHSQEAPTNQIEDLDKKWEDLYNDLKNDLNTKHLEAMAGIEGANTTSASYYDTWVNEDGRAMAELRTEVIAGDAKAREYTHAYTDSSTEIAGKNQEFITELAGVDTSILAVTKKNQYALARMTTELEAGDARIKSESLAYSDTVSGAIEARVITAINHGDDAISEELGLTKDKLGKVTAFWEVAQTVDELTSSVGLVTYGAYEGTPARSKFYVKASEFNFSQPGYSSKSPFNIDYRGIHMSNVILGSNNDFSVNYDEIYGHNKPANGADVTDYYSYLINNDKLTNSQKHVKGLFPNANQLVIKSGNYNAGSSGFAIDYQGRAEFASGVFRGDIIAESLTIVDGASIPGSIDNSNTALPTVYANQTKSVISGGSVSKGTDWWIKANGSVLFNKGTFKGRIEAASGTFAGKLKARSGDIDNVTIGENCIIKGKLSIESLQSLLTDVTCDIRRGSRQIEAKGANVRKNHHMGTFKVRANQISERVIDLGVFRVAARSARGYTKWQIKTYIEVDSVNSYVYSSPIAIVRHEWVRDRYYELKEHVKLTIPKSNTTKNVIIRVYGYLVDNSYTPTNELIVNDGVWYTAKISGKTPHDNNYIT